jgi:hypothetical protein
LILTSLEASDVTRRRDLVRSHFVLLSLKQKLVILVLWTNARSDRLENFGRDRGLVVGVVVL